MDFLVAFWTWAEEHTGTELAGPPTLRVRANWNVWRDKNLDAQHLSEIASLRSTQRSQSRVLGSFFDWLRSRGLSWATARLVIYQLACLRDSPLSDWEVPKTLRLDRLQGVTTASRAEIDGTVTTEIRLIEAIPVLVDNEIGGGVEALNLNPVNSESARVLTEAPKTLSALFASERITGKLFSRGFPHPRWLSYSIGFAWTASFLACLVLFMAPMQWLPSFIVAPLLATLTVVVAILVSFYVVFRLIALAQARILCSRLQAYLKRYAFGVLVNTANGQDWYVAGSSYGFSLVLAMLRGLLHLDKNYSRKTDRVRDFLLRQFREGIACTGVVDSWAHVGSVEALVPKALSVARNGRSNMLVPKQKEVHEARANLAASAAPGSRPNLRLHPCSSVEDGILALVYPEAFPWLARLARLGCVGVVSLLLGALVVGDLGSLLAPKAFATDVATSAPFILLFDESAERDETTRSPGGAAPAATHRTILLRAKTDQARYFLLLRLDHEIQSDPIPFVRDAGGPQGKRKGNASVSRKREGNAVAEIRFGEISVELPTSENGRIESNLVVVVFCSQQLLWRRFQDLPLAEFPLQEVMARVNKRADSFSFSSSP